MLLTGQEATSDDYMMDMVRYALVAAVLGALLQPLVLRAMTAAAVIDTPSERSSHTAPTPRGGGLASVAAAGAALLLYRPTWVIVVPLLLFAAIGLAEDLRGVAVGPRLGWQLLAGTLSGLVLVSSAPTVTAAVVVVVAVAVWLTGFANAFNFMDGVNGFATVHAIVAGIVYAFLGWRYDLPVLVVAGAAVAAAAATFLPWNAGRARIFLGDVGSYGLGGVLGALAAYGLLHGIPTEAVLAPLAIQLADTGWTLARRAYRREAWYRPHRTHAYQRLTDVGWSHQRVTVVTAIISAVLCIQVLAASGGGPLLRFTLDGVAVAILSAYLASPSWLAARRRTQQSPSLPRV